MAKQSRIIGCGLAALTIVVLCGGLVSFRFLRFINSSNRHMTVREVTRFAVPETTFELLHSRIGINPIVAEYNRDITYIQNGIVGKTTPLSIDTCGGYPINCYLIQTGSRTLVRFDDAVSEHVLDLNSQITYVITRYEKTPYFGELTDNSASSGWSMSNNDPSTLEVHIGGNVAKPFVQLTSGVSEVYIGRLSGGLDRLRFVPVAESPETPIRHLMER